MPPHFKGAEAILPQLGNVHMRHVPVKGFQRLPGPQHTAGKIHRSRGILVPPRRKRRSSFRRQRHILRAGVDMPLVFPGHPMPQQQDFTHPSEPSPSRRIPG